MCHHAIDAGLFGQGLLNHNELQIVFRCTRSACHRLFIGRYVHYPENSETNPAFSAYWKLADIQPRMHVRREFAPEVVKVSERFGEIYRQAARAESIGLDQICGPGYRKALEFLIKDFLKAVTTDEAKKVLIEDMPIGGCIATYVTDPRLKATALRAAWLGNDETHYVRKWEDKDLSDMKKLIDLSVHWVSVEILTRELESSMPDPKARARGAE